MKNIILLILFFISWGCIDDNGNYEYRPVRELQVLGVDNVYLSQDESVTITPKIVVKGDKTETAIENVEFEWKINNKVVSTEPTYTYIADSEGRFYVFLRFVDPLTKVVGTHRFEIEVNSKFNKGLIVLSEDKGKGMLSFIRAKDIGSLDTIVFEGEWKDIYAEFNGGEELKGIPYSVTEHWYYDDYNSVPGELAILSDDGGQVCVQEVNGSSMKRETYIEQEFDGGRLPMNFTPKQIMHTCWDSFILDESGVIYNRRSATNKAFHTGYFSDKVQLWNGQKFSKLIFTKYNNTGAVLAIEIDKQSGKHNYVGITADYNNEHKNLYRVEFVDIDNNVNIDDFKDIQEEIIFSDWRNTGGYKEYGMSVVSRDANRDYFLHCFVLDKPTSTTVEVVNSTKINLTKEHGVSKVVSMCTNKLKNFTYYCDENTIYALDNLHNNKFYEVKKFDKKIVDIADYSLHSDSGFTAYIAVAFEDGTIEIWECSRENQYEFHTRVYVSQANYGNIKDILFKNYNTTFFNR